MASDHYIAGSDIVEHRNKLTRTIVTNEHANNFVRNLDSLDYRFGIVPAVFAHRPDLLSNVFFGSPRHWWLFLVMNNEPDPFEGLGIGERIKIPTDAI